MDVKKYTCVNCGEATSELYKQYSPTVLKVMTCRSCHHVADKYIEYDSIIIITDLILLNKQAYRHTLYNTKFESHWKLAVLLLLMETYSEWVNTSSDLVYMPILYNKPANEEYQKEKRFYFICLTVIIGTIVFVSTISIMTRLTQRLYKRKNDFTSFKETNFFTIWKAVTLSSFGRFLHLPALIWGDFKVAETHFVFVLGYTILTQLLVHSVIICCSRKQSTIIILIAYVFKIYFTQLFSLNNRDSRIRWCRLKYDDGRFWKLPFHTVEL
ncbi:protein ARV1 [Chrysoperla carnea]|uniref:protein ARV1 n=1 Tax=Chrysoperla carnea TaxID=189513 RepID=UPI001D073F0F|nr:protein ARV1 [Chrysoperla carnea]